MLSFSEAIDETPMETLNFTDCPPSRGTFTWAIFSLNRSATSIAYALSVSGKSTANSSPPMRPRISTVRKVASQLEARALSTASGQSSPEEALTATVAPSGTIAAAAWADRIVALRNGALVAAGSPEEVIRPEVLEQIYGVRIGVTRHEGRLAALYHWD